MYVQITHEPDDIAVAQTRHIARKLECLEVRSLIRLCGIVDLDPRGPLMSFTDRVKP